MRVDIIEQQDLMHKSLGVGVAKILKLLIQSSNVLLCSRRARTVQGLAFVEVLLV
jgi:hypothetical protein